MDISDPTDIMKTVFVSIIDKHAEILEFFTKINDKRSKLETLYKQLVNDNDAIIDTLDIFNFQIRLLNNDINYLHQKYGMISNRIYCQYFKMYLQIQEYIQEAIPEIQTQIPKSSFPIYDDTNLTKSYEFKIICDIHDCICTLITLVIDYLKEVNQDYKKYQTINNTGIHINLFVDTFRYNIKMKLDQMILFTNMVRFYNTTSLNYYNKISNTIDIITNNLCKDISFELIENISGKIESEDKSNNNNVDNNAVNNAENNAVNNVDNKETTVTKATKYDKNKIIENDDTNSINSYTYYKEDDENTHYE